MSTLFGHLALSFGSHPENLATEALNFVLGRSPEARRLFAVALSRSGAILPAELRFVTQAADEKGAIPDLVGVSSSGSEAVIVEAKFWAGLTPRQPNAYLDRLPPGGLLAFVAPALRFESLWPVLLTRCREKARGFAVEDRGPNWRVALLEGDRRLALTSWRAVLADLYGGLIQAGELACAADVLQLQGLTERMDTEAFLPLRSEELTASTGRRIIQFCQLVDAVVERLRAKGLADKTATRSGGDRNGSYYRPFRLGAAGCDLYFDTGGWAIRGIPFTLRVQGANWHPSKEINDALGPLGAEDPLRLIVTDKAAYVPIRVPFGVEYDAVVGAMVAQVERVAELIAHLPVSGGLPPNQTTESGPNPE